MTRLMCFKPLAGITCIATCNVGYAGIAPIRALVIARFKPLAGITCIATRAVEATLAEPSPNDKPLRME
jgi:hypothetical protein